MRDAMIVLAVPANYKGLLDAVRDIVARVESLRAESAGGRAIAHEEVDRALGAGMAKLEREAHARALAALDVDAARIMVRGKVYSRIGRTEGTYFTLAGEVRVERTLYREAGIRNGATLDPISVRAGVIGRGWCPQAAKAMAFLAQQGTAREAEKSAQMTARLPYCASSFERVGHAVGAAYRAERADIEDALIEEFVLPEAARSSSVSIDRVAVPMEEPRPRPRGRPRKDAPKRFVTRTYRMAWCGTVTVHDAAGDTIETIRYGAMPNADIQELCSRMAVDLQRLQRRRPDLRVTLLADGARENWKLLESHFPESVFGPTTSLVDFWHTIEKLAAAAKVIHGETDARAIVLRWTAHLRRSKAAAHEIRDELASSGKETVRAGEGCPVHDAMTYIQNHEARMDYATARKAGRPIGSGNVEATCKSLFAVRFKRPGSRWHNETGENIVQLRALGLSDRWESAMERLFATQRAAVRAAT